MVKLEQSMHNNIQIR